MSIVVSSMAKLFRGTRARARRRRGSRRYRTLEGSAASPTPACPLLPPPAAGVVPLTALLPLPTSQAGLCVSRAPRAARWARGRRADVVAAAAEPVRAHQPTCTPAKSGARRCCSGGAAAWPPPRRRALEGRDGGLGRPWPPPRPGRRRPGWARRRGCGRPRLRRSSGPGGRLRARRAVPLGLHAFPRKKIAVNRGV